MSSGRSLSETPNRRTLLRAGAATLFGRNLAPSLLFGNDNAGVSTPGTSDLSVIIVWLKGGLSTIDTFDMKPEAPAEIRGEFRLIATSVPGIQVCEHLPNVARQMDKF
ncbi:MAG: DUF1501 domain-containing protein, partial [Planctomycetes bacterium]|nr:DUF1501 domain-containing protein [Planctomycetota bacterium]